MRTVSLSLLLVGLLAMTTTCGRAAASECLIFPDDLALAERTTHWQLQIEQLSPDNLIAWLTGVQPAPDEVLAESQHQMHCLLRAMEASLNTPLVPGIVSSYRSFAHQKRIWERKFRFQGHPFDRISSQVLREFPGLNSLSGQAWDPDNLAHDLIWSQLQPWRRQLEILQASSAPGLSRHHWGTDMDILDSQLDSYHWLSDQRFYTHYRWLKANAHTYGFFQPYSANSGGYGRGYMEERWHWSYYPVAHALRLQAQIHSDKIEKHLHQLWAGGMAYSYVGSHWQDYFFNTETMACCYEHKKP